MRIIFLLFLILKNFNAHAIYFQNNNIDTEKVAVMDFIMYYEVEHYFSLRLQKAVKFMKEVVLKSSNALKALESLIKKAQRGHQDSRILLSYLYFDKQFADQMASDYKSYFADIPWNDRIQKSIHSLFYRQNGEKTYEAYFIEALKNYFQIKSISNSVKILESLAKSLYLFNQVKDSGIQEYKFFWAFITLDFHYSGMRMTFSNQDSFADQNIKEAKSFILQLAKRGYIPAQYLQGFIDVADKHIGEALYWFERTRKWENHKLANFIILAIIYKYFKKNQEFAKSFLEAAIYENDIKILKPDLLDIYILENNVPFVLRVAEEILRDYTIYPKKTIFPTLTLMGLLLNENGESSKGNVLENSISAEADTFLTRVGVKDFPVSEGQPKDIFAKGRPDHFVQQTLSDRQINKAQKTAAQHISFELLQSNEACRILFH